MLVINKPMKPFGGWTASYVMIDGRYCATIQENNGRHSLEIHNVLTKRRTLPKCLQPLANRSWDTHDKARAAVKRAYENSPPETE